MGNQKSAGGILLPAIFCTLLWGSAFPSVKSGYALFGIGDDPFNKLYFAGWRFMLAGIVVLIVYAVLYRKSVAPARGSIKGILLLGIVQTTFQYVFFYIGLSHTTGVKGSVLTATTTFLAVLASHFLFPNDKINGRKAVGCLVGFIGVVLISTGSSGELLEGGFAVNGEGFMLLSAAAAAAGAVISKVVARDGEPMIITGWQLTFGGALLLVMGIAGGGHFEQTPPQGIALLGYMIFLSAAAFTIWTILLKKYPVGRVTVYNFLVPVFGSLMSGMILGETVFTGRNVLSLLFVCAGIILVNWVTDRTKQTIERG